MYMFIVQFRANFDLLSGHPVRLQRPGDPGHRGHQPERRVLHLHQLLHRRRREGKKERGREGRKRSTHKIRVHESAPMYARKSCAFLCSFHCIRCMAMASCTLHYGVKGTQFLCQTSCVGIYLEPENLKKKSDSLAQMGFMI